MITMITRITRITKIIKTSNLALVLASYDANREYLLLLLPCRSSGRRQEQAALPILLQSFSHLLGCHARVSSTTF